MPFRAARTSFALCTMLLLASVGILRAQKAAFGNGGPGPIKADHVTVELVTAGPEIATGGTQTLGFVFTLEDKWHIYWKNAGFAGFPPSADWKLPQGVTAGDLQFAQPSRLPFQGAVDYGYEDNATYPVVITAAPSAKPGKEGTLHLAAHVKWLVCREQCVPGTADLGIDLKLVPAGTAVSVVGTTAGPIAAALKHIPRTPDADFSATAVSDGKHIAVTFLTGTRETEADFYPLDEQLLQDNADQPVEPLPNGIRSYLTLLPNTPAPKQLHGVIELSDDESYEITASVTPGTVTLPSGGLSLTSAPGTATQSAGDVSVVAAVGLALLGGVILNLMPCVFPVLFLKALSLVQSSGEEKQRSRVHGLVYTAGIVASFWVIVAVLLALRSGGARFGWGFQLQSPGFVAVLALLLFFFALSLSGVFELGLSLTSAGDSLTRKQGYAGSFFTGVLATVVATPCVGPFLGVAIGYALAQPAIVTVLVFTALGLGLALPYLAVSFSPALIRWLPKPGAWMETLKQITAFPLYATVIWLVYIYGRLFTSGDTTENVFQSAALLTALLVLAIAAWVLGRWHTSRIATLLAILFAAVAVALPFYERPTAADLAAQRSTSTSANITGSSSQNWQPFTPEALDRARAEGKTVFVDFTAAWCLSCQVNEKLVLRTDEVREALKQGNFALLRADWTQYDPAITNALSAIGRSGVPTYVLYPAASSAKPDVLPELLTKSVVLDALKRHTGN